MEISEAKSDGEWDRFSSPGVCKLRSGAQNGCRRLRSLLAPVATATYGWREAPITD